MHTRQEPYWITNVKFHHADDTPDFQRRHKIDLQFDVKSIYNFKKKSNLCKGI